jgi:Flp pilus assembly protein TadB
MNRNLFALIITIVASLGLFGLGYEFAYTRHQEQLEICRRLAKQESDRAGKLAGLNQALEQRLTQAKAESSRQLEKKPAANADQSRDKAARRSLTLHKGRAVVFKDGLLILVLEAVDLSPRRAAIKVKVRGGGEKTAVLGPGSSLGIRLPDKVVNLVVKNIHASSAYVTLLGL